MERDYGGDMKKFERIESIDRSAFWIELKTWLKKNRAFCILVFTQLSFLLIGISYFEGRRHGDEELHLRVIEESVRTGHWLVPVLDGQPFFNKPPLLFWLSMILCWVFQNARVAGRCIVLVFFALASLLVYLLALRSYASVPVQGNLLSSSKLGKEEGLVKENALLAVVTFSSSLGIFYFSRIAMLDIPLVASLLAVVYFGCRYSEEKKPWLIRMACFFLVIGNQWKGPLFTVFLIPTLVLFFIEKRIKFSELRKFWPEIVLSILISFSWQIAMSWRYGRVFFDYFFINQSVSRIGESAFSRLIYFLCLGGFPWLFHYLSGLSDPKILRKFESKVALSLILGNLLPFIRVGDPHFHWMLPAIVGFSILPWRQGKSSLSLFLSQRLGTLVLIFSGFLVVGCTIFLDTCFRDQRGSGVYFVLGFSLMGAGVLAIYRNSRALIFCGIFYFCSIALLFYDVFPVILTPLRVPESIRFQLRGEKVYYLVAPVDPGFSYFEQVGGSKELVEIQANESIAPKFANGSLVVLRVELLPRLKQSFQVIAEWKKARDGMVRIPWGLSELWALKNKSDRMELMTKISESMAIVRIKSDQMKDSLPRGNSET